jgi:AraC-like DNA-binding protein
MSCLNDIFRSIEYINNNITQNLTIDECSRVAALSKPYYSTMFHFYIGDTPKNYIQKCRLLYSAYHLFGNNKIIDIALITGYQSHEAFTRAFKKEFGMSPSEYRELKKMLVVPIQDLNDIECAFLFHSSSTYNRKGRDLFKNHKDIQRSLIEKGYINKEKMEWSVEGKQLSDKYYYDCTTAILQNYKLTDDLETVYQYTRRIINISRLLFSKFIFELYENGFIIDVGIGSCGSNCFQCNAFLATIEDDDDLRMKYINEMNLQGVNIDKEEVYCLGCMSGTMVFSLRTAQAVLNNKK